MLKEESANGELRPASACSSSSPHARSFSSQLPQQLLLHCFAIADLFGLRPAVLHEMAAAAAADAVVSQLSSGPSDISSTSTAVEAVLVNAVFELVRNNAKTAALLSSVPAHHSSSSPTSAAAKGNTNSHNSISSSSSSNTIDGGAAFGGLLPRSEPSKAPLSLVEAPPWTAPSADTSALHTPSPLSMPPSPSSPVSLSSLLPPVLSSSQGITRIEALHPTFVLRLLSAMVQAEGKTAEGQWAGTVSYTPASSSSLTPSATPRQSSASNVAGLTVPPGGLPSAEQMGCRRAALQLLQLYKPVVRKRQHEVQKAVHALHDGLRNEAKVKWSAETGAGVHGELEQILSQRQWLEVLQVFLAIMVDFLSSQTRRADRLAQQRQQPNHDGADTHNSRGTPPSAPGSTHNPPSDSEAADAVWTLTTAGVVLALLNEERSDAVATSSVSRVEAMAVAPILCAMVEEHKLSQHTSKDKLTSATDGEKLMHRLRLVFLKSMMDSSVHHAIRPHGEKKLSTPHSSKELSIAVSPPSQQQQHINNAEENDEDEKEICRLVKNRFEQQQKQHHRLLAAAERAVQRVLRLPHAELWKSPDMLVALCSVTVYQLRTQHRQRQQRLSELAVGHENVTCGMAEGGAESPDPLKAAGEGCCDCVTAFPETSPSVQEREKKFGEALWSEEEEEEVLNDDKEHDDNDEGIAEAGNVEAEENCRTRAEVTDADRHTTHEPERSRYSPCVTAVEQRSRHLYTPRASSLSRAALPPVITINGIHPIDANNATSSAPLNEDDGVGAHDGEVHHADPLLHLSSPAHYFSPTRSMELLWELPARVPRSWSPMLSTFMACCALCVTPTSTAASQLRLLLADEGREVPLPSSAVVNTADTDGTPYTIGSPSTQSSVQASPRPSLLDFGFGRRRDTAAPDATAKLSGPSTTAAEGGGGRAGSPAPTRAAPSSSSSQPQQPQQQLHSAVVGAMAQWHLRGLIAQLRIAAEPMVVDAPSNRTVGHGSGGSSYREKRSLSVSAVRGGRGAGVLLPSVVSSTVVPSSAGATGGASWFAAYTQTNKLTPLRDKASLLTGVQGPAAEKSSRLVIVARRVSPVHLLSSCAALQHLLRSHTSFFRWAQLGGSTMRELRAGVTAARRCGGLAGNVVNIMQCAPTTLAAAATTAAAATMRGKGGVSSNRSAGARPVRGRSLWGDAYIASGGTADRSVTATLDAILTETSEQEGMEHSSEWTPQQQQERYGGTDSGPDATVLVDVEDATPMGGDTDSSGGGVAGRTDGMGGGTTATSCAATEAIMVAVSFLGSSVVAEALPHFLDDIDSSTHTSNSGDVTSSRRLCASITQSQSHSQQQQWCDALQALTGLLLDAHRVHRSRHSGRHHASHAPTAAAPEAPRGESVNCTREGSPSKMFGIISTSKVTPPRESASTATAFSPHTPATATTTTTAAAAAVMVPPFTPPSLSTEAQFGIGAFFVSLVRALLDVHARNVKKTQERKESENDAWNNEEDENTPSSTVSAELLLAQCVFAVATVADALLHDYAHAPPAALCDVLAMLTSMQLPYKTCPLRSAREEEDEQGAQHSVWAALRATPYWDAVLLASVESASVAWNTPAEALRAASVERGRGAADTTDTRRLSQSFDTATSSLRCTVMPRESLLGYIPCSRDPCAASWLPPTARASRKPLSSDITQTTITTEAPHTDAAADAVPADLLEDGTSKSLLELMADEDDWLLSTHALHDEGEEIAGGATVDFNEANNAELKSGDVDEAWQLSVAVAASRRYLWWATRLHNTWQDA